MRLKSSQQLYASRSFCSTFSTPIGKNELTQAFSTTVFHRSVGIPLLDFLSVDETLKAGVFCFPEQLHLAGVLAASLRTAAFKLLYYNIIIILSAHAFDGIIRKKSCHHPRLCTIQQYGLLVEFVLCSLYFPIAQKVQRRISWQE